MKKIKFMLLSLAILAVVGGALAFKAKYTETFCTTLAQNFGSGLTCIDPNGGSPVALDCPNKVVNSTFTTLAAQRIYCTTTFDVDPVTGDPICPATKDCVATTYSVRINN